MFKKYSNIVFFVFLLITVAELFLVFNVFNIVVSDNFIVDVNVVYAFLSVVAAFFLLKFVAMSEKNRPKEEVKIIYKNFDKEKAGQDFIEKKSKDKALKISENFVADLDKIDNVEKFTEKVLSKLAKNFHIVQGIFYLWNEKKQSFVQTNTFAFYSTEAENEFITGEGIHGQVAKDQKFLLIDNIPDDYVKVGSGLGEGKPKYLAFIPVVSNEKTIAIIEFATFIELPTPTDSIFQTLADNLAPLVFRFV